MKRNLYIVVGFIAVLVVIGCGAGGNDKDTGTVTDKGGSTTTTTATDAPKAQVAKMGTGKVTLKSGLVITVSAPKKFAPSAYAAGHTAGNSAVQFAVTFENKTGEVFDTSAVMIQAAFGKEGVSAEQVYDSGKNISIVEGSIAAGKKKTFTVAFSAPTKDLSGIDVSVEPSFLGDEIAQFEGTVK